MDVVLLGFIDQPVSDPSAVSWDTNKIGGSPVSVSASVYIVICCIGPACICLLFCIMFFLFINALITLNGYTSLSTNCSLFVKYVTVSICQT